MKAPHPQESSGFTSCVAVFALVASLLAGWPAAAEAGPRALKGYITNLPPESASESAARHQRVAERRAGTIVIVHRGAAAFAPENTLEAYAAAAWDHVVAVNNYNADSLLRHPKLRLLHYKAGLFDGRRDMDPPAVRAALARPGEMVIVDDPRVIARELHRRPYQPVALSIRLVQFCGPYGRATFCSESNPET